MFLDRTLIALLRRARASWREASPVHRLDRGTSGVVLFAKTTRAARAIGAAFDAAAERAHEAALEKGGGEIVADLHQPVDAISKSYLALVAGEWPHGDSPLLIDTPIGLHESFPGAGDDDEDGGEAPLARKQRGGIWGADGDAPRPARTIVRRLASSPTDLPDGERSRREADGATDQAAARTTLVEARLLTGRPHQIRIHCAAAGHPLVGDPFYLAGGRWRRESSARPGDPGFRLHAWRLSLPHPATGEPLNIEAPPPDWAAALL
jgi:23S rRNA pseudouridine1911/1915/1917 synthase